MKKSSLVVTFERDLHAAKRQKTKPHTYIINLSYSRRERIDTYYYTFLKSITSNPPKSIGNDNFKELLLSCIATFKLPHYTTSYINSPFILCSKSLIFKQSLNNSFL